MIEGIDLIISAAIVGLFIFGGLMTIKINIHHNVNMDVEKPTKVAVQHVDELASSGLLVKGSNHLFLNSVISTKYPDLKIKSKKNN